MMKLKDGFNVCDRCSGKGCYRCHKKGYLLMCPTCANSELELFTKSENQYECLVCETAFDKAGEVILTST